MSDSTQVSLTLDVNAGPLQRELAKASREYEKLQKVAGRSASSRGALSVKPIMAAAQGAAQLNKEVGKAAKSYKSLADIAKKFWGSKATPRKDHQPQRSDPVANRPSGGEGWQTTHVRSYRPSAPRGGGGGMGGGGNFAVKMLAKIGGWAWNQAQQGQAVLGRYQAARAGTQALAGTHRYAGYARRDSMREGQSLAYGRDEVDRIIQQTMLATGRISSPAVKSNMQMMRAHGMDMGTLGGLQQMARIGGDDADASEINKALVQSLKMGAFPRALATELARASTGLISTLQEGQGRVSASQTMGMLSLLSKRLGGHFAGNPSRTAGFVNRMHHGIRNPRNEDSKVMMLTALGMGRTTNYVGALRKLDQGATPENLKAIVGYFKKHMITKNKDGTINRQASRDNFGLLMKGFFCTSFKDSDQVWNGDFRKFSKKDIAEQQTKQGANTANEARGIAGGLTVKQRQEKLERSQAAMAHGASKLLDAQVNIAANAMARLAPKIDILGTAVENLSNRMNGNKPRVSTEAKAVKKGKLE